MSWTSKWVPLNMLPSLGWWFTATIELNFMGSQSFPFKVDLWPILSHHFARGLYSGDYSIKVIYKLCSIHQVAACAAHAQKLSQNMLPMCSVWVCQEKGKMGGGTSIKCCTFASTMNNSAWIRHITLKSQTSTTFPMRQIQMRFVSYNTWYWWDISRNFCQSSPHSRCPYQYLGSWESRSTFGCSRWSHRVRDPVWCIDIARVLCRGWALNLRH